MLTIVLFSSPISYFLRLVAASRTRLLLPRDEEPCEERLVRGGRVSAPFFSLSLLLIGTQIASRRVDRVAHRGAHRSEPREIRCGQKVVRLEDMLDDDFVQKAGDGIGRLARTLTFLDVEPLGKKNFFRQRTPTMDSPPERANRLGRRVRHGRRFGECTATLQRTIGTNTRPERARASFSGHGRGSLSISARDLAERYVFLGSGDADRTKKRK